MITSSIVRWLVTVSMTVLLQLCCCKIEQVIGVLGGHVGHPIRSAGSCCAGETGSSHDQDDHADADHAAVVVDSVPHDSQHHDLPGGPCKCACDSRHSYADNSQTLDFGWMTWAMLPIVSARIVVAPIERSTNKRPEVRCRGGPSVSLSILYRTLLV